MRDFHLQKWYFDGVDSTGRALIAYSAQLKWHGIQVPYSGYLYLRAPGDVRSENKFVQAAGLEVTADAIDLKFGNLPVHGRWERSSRPITQRLYENETGYLDWHCHMPAAQCQIQVKQDPLLKGWGYVEMLEMTLPPWQLGLDELRWGRFADPDWPVVWIDWIGKLNRRWIFANGRLLDTGGVVSDNVVEAPDKEWALYLKAPQVLEEKEKMKEVFQALASFLPGIYRMAPLRFIGAAETKWLSEGELHRPGMPPRKAWVIHELVKF